MSNKFWPILNSRGFEKNFKCDLIIFNFKGLDVKIMNETPKIIGETDKPLNSVEKKNTKVDINVLKARAKAVEDKENTKNKIAIIFFLLALSVTGIYFST